MTERDIVVEQSYTAGLRRGQDHTIYCLSEIMEGRIGRDAFIEAPGLSGFTRERLKKLLDRIEPKGGEQ